MSVQLTYADTPAIAFNGMLAEEFSLRQIDSGLVEDAGGFGLGIAVKHGTEQGQYVPCVADDDVVAIVIFATQDVENPGGAFTYADKASFPALNKGRYYATSNAAIAAEDAVAFDPATGRVGAVSGGVTTTAFGKAKTASAGAGELIIVEVDF